MEDLVFIYNTYLTSESQLINSFDLLFNFLNIQKPFKCSQQQIDVNKVIISKWMNKLNTLLQSKSPEVRFKSCQLVQLVIPQSGILFEKHAVSWMTYISQNLKNTEPISLQKLSIQIVKEIFERAQKKAELKKDLQTFHLPRFCDLLFSSYSIQELHEDIFESFRTLIITYPIPFKALFPKIEAICLKSLDSGHFHESVGTCLIQLSTVGKVDSKEGWTSTVRKLISTIHILLSDLFSSIEEDQIQQISANVYHLSPIPDNDIGSKRFPFLVKRIIAFSEALITAISYDISFSVTIPTEELLHLTSRILSIDRNSIAKEKNEKHEYSVLLTILPQLHIHAFKMLSQLAISVGENMISYLSTISRACQQFVLKSEKFGTFRQHVFETCFAMICAFGDSFLSNSSSWLIPSLLNEIESFSTSGTQEKVLPGRNTLDDLGFDKKALKKKRKHQELVESKTSSISQENTTESSSIVLIALKVLESCLTFISSHHWFSFREETEKLLLTLLLNFPNDSDQEDSLDEIRYYCFRCLFSSIVVPSSSQFSTLPMAIRLFSSGKSDPQLQIRMFCHHASQILFNMTHSKIPYFGPPSQKSSQSPVKREQPRFNFSFLDSSKTLNGSYESIGQDWEMVDKSPKSDIDETNESLQVNKEQKMDLEADMDDVIDLVGDQQQSSNEIHFISTTSEQIIEKKSDDDGEITEEITETRIEETTVRIESDSVTITQTETMQIVRETEEKEKEKEKEKENLSYEENFTNSLLSSSLTSNPIPSSTFSSSSKNDDYEDLPEIVDDGPDTEDEK